MIIVVEPHADDAFLSLGGHLDAWRKAGEATTIVTVFSGTRNRGAEAATYAAAVGAEWFGLGLVETTRLGGEIDQETACSARRAIAGVCRDERARMVFPLGLQHPEHRLVAAAAPAGADRYVEIPYGSKPSNADEATELLAGRTIVSWLRPHARKYRHVPIFRDQAKFFHYNPTDKLVPIPEVLVR